MGKMDKKWVLLCSTAVAAVYAAGYYTTESEAAMNQPIQHIANHVKTNRNSAILNGIQSKPLNGGQSQGQSEPLNGGQTNDQSGKASNGQTKSSLYKDGTFTGSGMNRRGYIDVKVTIRNDKITNVMISDFGMHYSEDDVVGLPNEVLQKQSPQVRNVSGATYSTQAFEEAVQDALNQAQNQAG